MPSGCVSRERGKILIIGGGPTGLGAAWRLNELGHDDWELLEREDRFGGLASSRVDEHGFTWDLGGHVVFSHYRYFDDVLSALLPGQWIEHVREAWVWMRDRFIPYPLQNNIRYLPSDELLECLDGLLEAHVQGDTASPSTFADWIVRSFGVGLARVFMTPYNRKVWACDPAEMTSQWVAERVATTDLKRILRNVILQRDDLSWGPNATFRFPRTGGTGRIWNAVAEQLPPDRLRLGMEVLRIDSDSAVVHVRDGEPLHYDWLISTMPMNVLLTRLAGCDDLRACAETFTYAGTHVIGVALAGPVPEHLATKCWIYFPERELPFYRATVFSNYSPNNVPRPERQWSLLAEVSESPSMPVDRDRVVEQTVEGLRAAGLVPARATIESIWHTFREHGYPTPFLGRDTLLEQIEPALCARNILSRGRFGAWRYEVGNMDHSFMQGVEAVDRILRGQPERTLESPDLVNAVRA